MHILFIEDNEVMARMVQMGLADHGLQTDTVFTAADGRERGLAHSYDLILLDRLLPDGDGLQVCQCLREAGVATPIIMLTGVGETQERVAGLESGADDYVVKPFEIDELAARIRALARRAKSSEPVTLRYEDLEMDLVRRVVRRAGRPLRLTNKEFALLEYLIRNSDRALSRTAIGEHVWNMANTPTSNVIDVYVSALRRKVDQGFDRPLLHTVIGSGYMLSAEKPPHHTNGAAAHSN